MPPFPRRSSRRLSKRRCRNSFNAITIDGDMSTNDTVILMASGAAGNRALARKDLDTFNRGVEAVSAQLARELVYDGEGATKLVTVEVKGAKSPADAERCARQIANSPLVKTAFFGNDPNVGRILMAAGSSGAMVESDRLVLAIARREGCRARRAAGRCAAGCGGKNARARVQGQPRSAARARDRDHSDLRPELRLR